MGQPQLDEGKTTKEVRIIDLGNSYLLVVTQIQSIMLSMLS